MYEITPPPKPPIRSTVSNQDLVFLRGVDRTLVQFCKAGSFIGKLYKLGFAAASIGAAVERTAHGDIEGAIGYTTLMGGVALIGLGMEKLLKNEAARLEEGINQLDTEMNIRLEQRYNELAYGEATTLIPPIEHPEQ